MITDEQIAQFPDDPQLAFIEFEKICRAHVQEMEQEVSERQWGDADPYRLEYINKVLAAARAYQIEALKDWGVPSAADRNIFESYRQFVTDVDHFTTQIRILRAPVNKRNSVGLDGNTKAKIHEHIQKIRMTIEAAELPDDKRDVLYRKLDGFALEVDKVRTDLQSGMAFYIAVCDGIGQGFTKLEPVRRMINSVAALMGRARADEETLPALPRAPERSHLEPPRKQLAPPARSKPSDLDDEIPF